MTQTERLDYLIGVLRDESHEYRNLQLPTDPDGRRHILRAMMNVRPPRALDPHTMLVQDAYLRQAAEDKGIVSVGEIPTLAEHPGCAHPFSDRLSLWQGDITRLAADAIVNAANAAMLGCFIPMHSCIDNCVHSYAGMELRAECEKQMAAMRQKYGPDYEQPTAVPMLTDAYNLPAKKIVHIVGPIVDGALTEEHERLLAACYRNTLDLCVENGLSTVAFCGISTGVFRFPKQRAAEIAAETVTTWLSAHEGGMDRVIFTVLSDRSREIYEHVLFGGRDFV